MEAILNNGGIFSIAIVLAIIVITILMIVAVLKIPKIARYSKAQLKIAVMQAKKDNVSSKELESIVLEAEKADSFTQDKVISDYKLNP